MAKKETKTKEKKIKAVKETKNTKAAKKPEDAQNDALAAQIKEKQANINIEDLNPEQLTQLQLEQAIKESNDPNARLVKLRNPFAVKNLLLYLLFFVLLTIIILYVVAFFKVDNFNFLTITKDMLEKFGITGVWNTVINWIKNLFT